MSFLDAFEKLDDIVYVPVKTICDWIEEPLKKWEHGRETDVRKLEAQLENDRAENDTRLQREMDEWEIKCQEMIREQEDAHNDKVVESIKNYQIQLANATEDIVKSIGIMSIELRREANNLVLEKTREYKQIQDEAKRQSVQELAEAKDMFFESDPDTYRMLVSDIMAERRSMVETAGTFITELSKDLKRLNENTDRLMNEGMKAVNRHLEPMSRALGNSANADGGDIKAIEKADVPENDVVDVDYVET